MPRVDIVIPNWNGLRYLPDCLTALQAQIFRDFSIWLVDNGSIDGSVEWVRSHAPQVNLLTNSVNRGFAAANNQAIRAGCAPYIATLNNDTVADPDWLAELIGALEADEQLGAAASLMVFADRPAMINSAGIAVDRLGIAWDRLGGRPVTDGEDTPTPVFGACAGAALYRRAMLEEIGLFDEDFFAYLEDVDLAWRAQWAGWSAVFVPSARVVHHHSATGGEGSPFKRRLLGRNKVWLILKNYPLPYLWLYWPLIWGYDAAAVARALVLGQAAGAVSGRWHGWLAARRAWRKRRCLLRRRSAKQIWAQLAAVQPPHAVLARYRHLQPDIR
ncbi:MAG: glycosyltransferase family 2 protein [Anaerolineae bacterium]|nr:glycosyltransferase family 2 protein [Thermoflexales bacterium]MDW8407488.1 glycosyltransferase family 2 protein [Anaerolineae bacterium]